MSRSGASRFYILFAALTVTLGLQTLRAFLPLVVHVYGARPGITSVDMGLLALAVFATGFLAAVPQRILGPRRALRFAATVLGATRLLAQFVDPGPALWLAGAGTVAFLWTVPALLAVVRGDAPEACARIAVGVLLGLALDVTVSGAFLTWDPIWQRSAQATLAAVVLVVAYAWLAGRIAHGPVDRSRTDVSLAAAWPLAALGPVLLLEMLVFQNPARLAAVTGWPLAGALLFILAADALALVVAARVRGAAGALLAAAVLVPAAPLAHGSGGSAAAGLAAGSLAAAVLITAVLAGQGRRPFHGGAGRTAVGWGLAMFLLAVLAFLYYGRYDLNLPFEHTALVPALALLAALIALSPARRMRAASEVRPAAAGAALVLVVFMVVPVVGGIVARPPQPQAGRGWPVRVASYNLHQGYATSGAQDLEALAATIEATDADVVAVQEVSRGWVINGSTDMLTWLAHRLRRPAVWGPAADPIWGNAIFSRYPILAWGHVALPRGGAPMRRGALWAEIDVGAGEPLRVMATHLHHVMGHGQVRELQAQAVIGLWGRRPQTVLLGDLNATPEAREITMLKAAGLRDAFEPAGAGEGFTYPSWRPARRIDYIWVSPDLSARDFRVLEGEASDHLAIAVTVSR